MLQLLHMMDDWTLCLEKGGQIDAMARISQQHVR